MRNTSQNKFSDMNCVRFYYLKCQCFDKTIGINQLLLVKSSVFIYIYMINMACEFPLIIMVFIRKIYNLFGGHFIMQLKNWSSFNDIYFYIYKDIIVRIVKRKPNCWMMGILHSISWKIKTEIKNIDKNTKNIFKNVTKNIYKTFKLIN